MSMLPMDQRDGAIWLDGALLPWRDARIHVLSHGLHSTRAFDCRQMPKAYNRRGAILHDRRTAMAKGQKRSNREVKKPKADKKKAPATAGSVPDALAKAKPGAAAAGKK
jgi:hypothetical protein